MWAPDDVYQVFGQVPELGAHFLLFTYVCPSARMRLAELLLICLHTCDLCFFKILLPGTVFFVPRPPSAVYVGHLRRITYFWRALKLYSRAISLTIVFLCFFLLFALFYFPLSIALFTAKSIAFFPFPHIRYQFLFSSGPSTTNCARRPSYS